MVYTHPMRIGVYGNRFLGINFLKKNKTAFQWGYPYGHSQYNTTKILNTPLAAVKV